MKEQICLTGKKIYNKGFAPGTSGNISCRVNDKILLTPTGANLGELAEQDIITTDLCGNVLEGKKAPSSEKFMHFEIYRKRPDIKCIIHAHPPKSIALGVTGKALKTALVAEAVVVLGEVPIVEYETPSTSELARVVAGYFARHDAVIMVNHGVTVAGKGISSTFYKLETLESISEISIITELFGCRNEIPVKKLDELMKIRELRE